MRRPLPAAGGWSARRSYQLVDANTGTPIAARWELAGGYGLSLDEIERVLKEPS